MADKATPTITLAELYENQNQYIDALVIYKNLYRENPSEGLQNKIEELQNKIFKENTLEYSTIVDNLFTDEEKRIFHILPHDQYKAYKDSQADIKCEETYPEELTKLDKEDAVTESVAGLEIQDEITAIDQSLEAEKNEINVEETITPEDSNKDNGEIDELDEDKNEKLIPDIEKIPEIEDKDALEIEEPIETKTEKEKIEINESSEKGESLEDDISLEIEEDFNLEPDKPEVTMEELERPDEFRSIEELLENKIEENSQLDNVSGEPEQLIEKEELEILIKPQDENKIQSLLVSLSKIRPDIVERVLKENVGADTPFTEIKLSDLNYVIELLKVSENVETD
ncbi:MAG: hypothetical protein P9L97_06750 [Candidatus Tenebribacter davisii]|nr:hypothetical protein [Candidatus Tenebribacter davisii]